MKEANEGQLYVCPDCGETYKSIYNFDSPECAMKSRLVYESHVHFLPGTTVVDAIESGGIIPGQPKLEDEWQRESTHCFLKST